MSGMPCGPGCIERIWEGFERGFDDLHVSQHGRCENVEPCAVIEQEDCDVPSAHVRRGAEGGFKISAAPIPGGVDQTGFLRQQFLHALQVAVGVSYEFFDQCSF